MLALTGAAFALLLALGVPVAFVLIALCLLWVAADPAVMDVALAQRLVAGTQSFPLLAVPLFVLAGELMNASGISRRVMAFAAALTRGMTGGLAKTNVVLSTLLAGMSGSANGDAAMQSKILVPEMARAGYPQPFAAAVTASSALIAPLIPPGIGLIMFGFVTDTSIGRLFAGAVLPGLLLAAALLLTVHLVARRQGWDPPRAPAPDAPPLGRAFLGALPAILMPVLIVVGIRGGVFTPSEAGGVAVAYTALFMAVYREAKPAEVWRALRGTVTTSAAILIVLAASSAFTWVLAFERVPQAVGAALLAVTPSPSLMLGLIALILLVAGMFIEGTALILILAPMLLPVTDALGIDPVHFGIVFVFVIQMGGITPPVGTVMFTTCAITGVRLLDFAAAVLPFLLVFALVAGILILVPGLTLWLAG